MTYRRSHVRAARGTALNMVCYTAINLLDLDEMAEETRTALSEEAKHD